MYEILPLFELIFVAADAIPGAAEAASCEVEAAMSPLAIAEPSMDDVIGPSA